jgi:hypothetical protein
VTIVRDGAIIVTKESSAIHADDKLYILGPPESLDSLLGKMIGLSDVSRRILITGSTRIAQRLFDRKSQITLLDASLEYGKRMSRIFQDIELIHGDASEPGILESAGVAHAVGDPIGLGIAFFGTMSGFTTTVAIFPLMEAEAPGPRVDNFTPRLSQTALYLLLIYLGMTVVFGTRNASVGAIKSAYIDAVLTVFMVLAGANFTIHWKLLHGDFKSAVKVGRFLTLFKMGLSEMRYLLNPREIYGVFVNRQYLKKNIVYDIAAMVHLYLGSALVSTLVSAAGGFEIPSSLTASLAAIGNIGPGFGLVGPASNYAFYFDWITAWLSFMMLLGRLEVYTVLILFTRAF